MSLPSPSPSTTTLTPSPFNYILSFLIVGLCWGFTTPFIRKAAITYQVPSNPSITDPNRSWLLRQIAKIFFSIIGLLRSPRYAVPLVLNLTGSIWFFLLVGQAGKLWVLTIFDCVYSVLLICGPELSLTVPITNSLAFLFTVLGEWYVDGKLITRDTWLGMGLVCAGIAMCVVSKT
jgi:drug/metabolite transporter (DMT)-like permease